MRLLRKLKQVLGLFLVGSLLASSLSVPASAAMITTADILSADTGQQQRAYVQELLARDEVRDQLVTMGVNPDDAAQRVKVMTDQEVQTMVSQLESLPAGGDAIGLLALVLVVLLITDLLKITDVYNL